MASISAKIDGVDELNKKLKALLKRTTKEVDEVLQFGAIEVHNVAKKNIAKGSRTGEIDPKTGRQRSAEGEYPKTDSGELVSSIFWEKRKGEWIVGSRALHAFWLEYGTSNMQPRPWLLVSLILVRPEINKQLTELAKRLL